METKEEGRKGEEEMDKKEKPVAKFLIEIPRQGASLLHLVQDHLGHTVQSLKLTARVEPAEHYVTACSP